MSTQRDIYAAGSKNCPPMLNKDNYVPWSSHLFHYAKSKPNGKLIYDSITKGPYVRRMISEPGDPGRPVLVVETFHEQTDEELTEKEVKQMEADDQAIQTILMGLPEDIYVAVNPSVQNVGNHNRLIVVLGIPNPNVNHGNGNVVAARAEVRPMRRDATYLQTQLLIDQKKEAGIQLQAEEFDLMVATEDLDEIEEVNENCILMANLQQASTSAKFVQDFKYLANEDDESLAKHKALEFEIEHILRAVVSQDIMSIVQNPTIVETFDLQTEIEYQKKHMSKVEKPKQLGSKERLASPKPSDPRIYLRWSPTGGMFDLKGKIIASSESECQSECSKGENACTSNHQEPTRKRFPNSTFSLAGTTGFANDHIAAILGNCTTNLYTINHHEMAYASPICIMARATSTKSWLWHQRLSHLNFDTIKDLAKNDPVTGLLKFKYHKEHRCPSCEQGKCKKASHPPKPVPNSKQQLHLLHMDLCGPMRVESINGKRKPDISFLHVFGDLCYPKNYHGDNGKLGAKGGIEYDIPEALRPELTGPEDRIVDFPKGKNNRFFWVDERVFPTAMDWRTSAPKDGMPAENTYSAKVVRTLDTHRTPIQKQPEVLLCLVGISRRYYLRDEVYPTFLHDDDRGGLIRAPNPTKVKTGSRPRAAHEVPLLTVTANQVIEMEDPATATDSSGVPSTIERSPLDFATEAEAEDQGTVALEVPPPEDAPTTRGAPEEGSAEGVAATDPSAEYPWGKSLAAIELGMRSTRPAPVPESAPVDVSDPDPLSFADPRSRHPTDVAQSSQGTAAAGDPQSENASFASMVWSPESIYRPKWGISNGSMLDTPEACQDLVDHVAPPGGDGVVAATEVRTRSEVAEEVCEQQPFIAAGRHPTRAEEKLKAAFEEFKQYEDNRVEQRCAKMDARLDALSIDFDEELYPHMLTAIAGRRWMIGRGLRLAVMKCGESLELRQAFADVVSAGIAKGMSEGLRHEVGHGQAQLSLESIEAYDPEAVAKYIAALQALKDLKYPLVDQLEGLKNAPIEVIMVALYLESDTGDDVPQHVRNLRPSSSQLTIPVYPEVRDPMNPWAYKEEMLLADAIAANVSRAEKKKKCRIVCRTHGVGSAHHARSDGVPVSVPTVVPQGLAILLADAATQMEPDDATLDNL
uniref:Retrovirus-related Pol polyprotein from transposon TNT 1-94 n=1 Tax=Tanacetum cinerariifolium TaxID=118510 RepID=A0A6L2JMN0_TANCI|nr:retrovirus-related Pol polyprotein from transposon TNT 1-94 [Tanacetum cinerariifolium]